MFEIFDDVAELLPELGAEESRVLNECERIEAAVQAAEANLLQEHHGNPRRPIIWA